MAEIIVPQLNTNDTHVVLVEWCVPDGAEVAADEVIAVLETSKAAEDLPAAQNGILLAAVKAGAEIAPGASIGTLCPDQATYDRLSAERTAASAAETATDVTLTDAARALVEQHNISAEQLRGLNRRTIRVTDLRPLLPPDPGAEPGPSPAVDAPAAPQTPGAEELALDKQQLAVVQVVTESHREVPDASVVMKVGTGQLLDALRSYEESQQVMVGLAAVIVAAVAALRAQFPRIFASYRNGQATLMPGAHVAVTTDVGTGLYLPVVPSADQRTVVDIAEQLMRFRIKAVRQQFEAAELANGNIAITLHADAGVVFAIPIIPPKLAAAISLCSIQEEVILDEDGSVRRRSYLNLVMTYDHRLINGRDAVLFVSALRDNLESRQSVEDLLGRRASAD
jgi:2-oxoglutarate dehydrogenase E2 component (dihydrolipoamide succinyltransferase)